MGDSGSVFGEGTGNQDNRAKWYRLSGRAWGYVFDELAPELSSGYCDWSNDDARSLCWHLTGNHNEHSGGYKCGKNNDLFTDDWERLVLQLH